MEAVSINANGRDNFGTAASKQIRKQGLVPAVIYQTGDAKHITVNPKDLKTLIYTPKFKVAEINIDGNVTRCIIKDIQFHPQSDEILHVDFQQLIDGTVIKVQIPIELTGQAAGVKTGGKLYQKLRRVKIKTLSELLVDKVQLDVSKLELGQSIRVRDIEAIDGIEIMNASGIPIASVEIPRALRSAQGAAAAAGEDEDDETSEEGEGGGDE